MKKIILTVIAAFMAASSFNAGAQSLRDILGSLTGSSSDTTATAGDNKGGSNPLDALGSFLGNATANSKFTLDDLTGTWEYVSPAVSFKSDNALKNIGGAGAATAVENKLSPYYQRLGLTKTSLIVAADHTFEMKLGLASLKGTVEKTDDGLVFNFSAFDKINLGKVNAHATKSGQTLNLTFDATRMIQILTKVAGVLNNASLNTLTKLINSYDNIYMGFKLKATK